MIGTLISLSVFVNFYLMTVFSLSWGTTRLGYTREQFLLIQLFGVLFFGLATPWSAILADAGRRRMLMAVNVGDFAFGLVLAPLFEAGMAGVTAGMALGMSCMGLAYGPLGTVLAELFPTAVRYTGSSLTYNLAGIFGASLAPYAATWLASNSGLRVRRLLPVPGDVVVAGGTVAEPRDPGRHALAPQFTWVDDAIRPDSRSFVPVFI